MSVLVRPGEPKDIDEAVNIYARARAARDPQRPPTPGFVLEEVRSGLHHDTTWFFMAFDGTVPVGMAVAMPSRQDFGTGPVIPGVCHLGQLFVAPERWGQGIGKLLLDTVIDEARRRGYKFLDLEVNDTNTRAQRLYETRGFKTTGIWRPSRDPGNGTAREWALTLKTDE